MKLLEYALLKLSEESSEVAQMCSKCTQFTLHEVKIGETLHNAGRLHAEIDDFLASVQVLNDLGLNYVPNAKAQVAKMHKMYKFLKFSEKLGTISSEDVKLFQLKVLGETDELS
jgi:hypothetical protein